MKPIRFYVALISAKLAIFTLRRLGRNGTHFPGGLALRICPDFLKYIPKPKKIVAITGTNGKTTVTNLISDVLIKANYTISNNAMGSNIQEGIITTMVNATNIFGSKTIVDYVVLEVDERISPKIYPYIKPDTLIITNLFRDSYRRNAHVDFIADILEKTIPKDTQLIVNADDPLSSFLCKDNNRISFSLDPIDNEIEVKDSRIKDLVNCPKCNNVLIYDFNRYHHIGKVHCPVCDYKSIEANIRAHLDVQSNELVVNFKDSLGRFRAIGDNTTDHYNLLSCVSFLYSIGLNLNQIQNELNKLEIVKSRYDVVKIYDKQIVIMMTKDQNPVATSRVFDYIRKQDHLNTAVILINENTEHHTLSENNAWYFDTDFEYLNQDFIKQIIGGGQRVLDLKIRVRMAGIDVNKYSYASNEIDTADCVDFDKVDSVFILNGTKNIPEAKIIRQSLINRLERGKKV
jgi:lipid II isoglutaminyl synthase (glutamine-hydrolysing)